MKVFFFELSCFELVLAFGGFFDTANGGGLALCGIQIVSTVTHLLRLQDAAGKLNATIEPSEKRFKAFVFSSCDFEHTFLPLSRDGQEDIISPKLRQRASRFFMMDTTLPASTISCAPESMSRMIIVPSSTSFCPRMIV